MYYQVNGSEKNNEAATILFNISQYKLCLVNIRLRRHISSCFCTYILCANLVSFVVKVQAGIRVTLKNIPHIFAAIQTGQTFSNSGWGPFETYIPSRNCESIYTSYDLETKIVFEKGCFPQCSSVSMRVNIN